MMRYTLLSSVAAAACLVLPPAAEAREQWSQATANAWYAKQDWLLGANYLPADAINQLEMWQPETFDPERIDKELGWAEGLGMNTMRVFLHDQLWAQDPEGFKRRIDTFLAIAAKHKIRPLFVLFDSCWDPNPKLGPQHPPIPGTHNSGWVQSPGRAGLEDERAYPRLEAYVKGVVGAFANDERILGWDVWNEPDNEGGGNYEKTPGKAEMVAKLLPQVFAWARSADPIQPLTSGVWHDDDWTSLDKLNPVERTQITQSDVITFHDYSWPETFLKRVKQLKGWGRPIICTEYMARGNGSTFDGSLPIAKTFNVGMMNWGFVDGKSQTRFPWDSWVRPYTLQAPTVWFHDVLNADGTPYRPAEADLLRAYRAAPKGKLPPRPY
jgi:hypothetical protein